MITNTWNIVQLDTHPIVDTLNDYVVQAHWTLDATDGTYNGRLFGSVIFEIDPNKTPYTVFTNITLEDTLAWVQGSLGAEQVASHEAAVADQIEAQINPTIVTPKLPWL